jgi:hypothetical protein
MARLRNNAFANLLGGDWGTFMPDLTDLLDDDCAVASDLKQLMLDELSDAIELDAKTVDTLVRGIASLLQFP